MSRAKGLADKSARHDVFYRRARQAGFVARSVFKLEEIDLPHRLLKPAGRVCDLGCRPGSWLQYAAGRVGASGHLVGIDRTPLDDAPRSSIERACPSLRTFEGDVHEIAPEALLGPLAAFDVMLSDMAPDTSGIRSMDQARSEALFERALDLAIATLAPGGHFVGKLFQGPDFQRLVARVKAAFSKGLVAKPKSSRRDSIEVYVLGLGHRP